MNTDGDGYVNRAQQSYINRLFFYLRLSVFICVHLWLILYIAGITFPPQTGT